MSGAVVLLVWLVVIAALPLCTFLAVIHFGRRIMATLQELQDDLNDVSVKVIEIADEIKALKEQGAQLVTQEQLDALDAKAEAIKSALDAAK